MLRRRLAAAALAALTAALLILPGVAAGAQTGDQALVRVAHFAPGLLKGDVYVVYVDGRLQLKGVPFKTVSDYLKVKPGKFKVEVREAGQPADSPPVIAATVSLEAGKAYTVAVFGHQAQAFSAFIALLTALVAAPLIAIATKGKYYIARQPGVVQKTCVICEKEYEAEDMAHCPAYQGSICSLCCTLEARCHDACSTPSCFRPAPVSS